ncbi:P1 family peptidase [Paenibacillus sp. R14(2021)]|uniref:P1 family peptidase n=1 Tax=Paenibacillus sp. R14(2021) TaxID=2859228 RepID=UPI001C614A79|nr:P1 family peptidase [Paenibacillus sp. R14(2021)]
MQMTGKSITFDFPSIRIGIAEYEEGPTGCTVFHFPNEATAAIDVRGGSPSTFTTDNHNLFAGERKLDAVCFTGGSVHGLEATSGVTSALLQLKEYSTSWMPKVVGATIYDYVDRDNAVYPDKLLGQKAFESAKSNIFPIGRQGAGRSAIVGKGFRHWEYSGQGGAFKEIGQTKIAAFTVVNAMGAILGRDGHVLRGYKDELGNREPIQKMLNDLEQSIQLNEEQNTTLTLVVTNQVLPSVYLRHLSKQIHTSMARAIYPFHSIFDGDVLFFVSTNEVENSRLDPVHLGLYASEVVWDAVLNCY